MRACAIITILTLAVWPSRAVAQIVNVWSVDDGEKVRPGDRAHPSRGGGLTYDAGKQTVRLFAARNEAVAFQVIVEAGDLPVSAVGIELESLGDLANDGSVSGDPDRYFVGRRIELFAIGYVSVGERSHDMYWVPDSRAEPAVATGRVPDPLIPLPSGGVDIPARENRGFWVDVTVPRDLPPGTRRGELRVLVGDSVCQSPGCRQTIELEVLDLELPERPRSRTMLWFSGGEQDRDSVLARYVESPHDAPASAAEAIRNRHHHLARRHRITLFVGQDEKPNDELRTRLSGELFTEASGYQGPGEGLGQDIYAVGAYRDEELSPTRAQQWSSWLKQHAAADAEWFYYAWDEPWPDEYEQVNRRAESARPLPSFTTAPFHPDLNVDVFAALPSSYSAKLANEAQDNGRRMWIYNGIRPYSGTFLIDDTAISPRVNPWIQYKYRIDRWFYWEATYYLDRQGGRGAVDVFRHADNFRNDEGDVGNGDGLLMYPGMDVLFPNSDHGVARPLPSIRLKNWRRGIQDVDYLHLAHSAGHSAFVAELLAAMIPAALADETRERYPVSWSERGQDWLEARRLVADKLLGRAVSIPDHLRRAGPPGPTRGPWIIAGVIGLIAAFVAGAWAWRRAEGI